MERKPRIALMTHSIDNRPAKGTAIYARRIVEQVLADNRFDTTLIHYDQVDDPIYKNAQELLIPKVKLPYGSRFVSQLLFFRRYRKDKFDIIHWFQGRLYPFYWLAPARLIVVTAHAAGDKTAPAFFNFPRIVFNFILTWFNKRIDACIAVSNYAREEIIKYYRFKPEKVHVTYNGGGEDFQPIDKEEALKKVQKKYSLPDSFILDVSRLQAHKNIETLIQAYIEMRDDYPERNESLVIVGSPVKNYRQPIDITEGSQYKNDIHFIHYIKNEDLNALYSAARLMAFPSLNEGFGFPVIEAMASGTPVITSNVTSLPEVSGNAAITIDPLDYKKLAGEMSRVLSDKNLYDSLVEKGLKRAKEFTWARTAEKTKEIYFKLLNEGRR